MPSRERILLDVRRLAYRRTAFMSTDALRYDKVQFAHTLRGVAALIVAFGAHLGGLFWQNRPVACGLLGIEGCPAGTLPRFVELVHHFGWLSFGHFGVALFFLISGFVIPFSLLQLRPSQFLVARAFRIFPTYWIALGLGLLILAYTKQKPLWASTTEVFLQAALVRDLAWIASIDGISWTLEIEIKFYILCALCAGWIVRGRTAALMLVLAGIGAVSISVSRIAVGDSLLTSWSTVQPYFGILHAIGMSFLFIVYMLIGTLFNLHYRERISSRALAALCVAAFLWFACVWGYNQDLRDQEANGVLNYLLALLCFTILYLGREHIGSSRVFSWLGDISYPLYAVHPIAGYALLYYLSAQGVRPIVATALTLLAMLALALALHHLVELPSNRIGKRIARSLGGKIDRRAKNAGLTEVAAAPDAKA
jgi:peptidoglycan/LPS O-acetylase OafA/YrhL